MLEILAIIYMSRSISKSAERVGQSKAKWILLFVGAWILNEIFWLALIMQFTTGIEYLIVIPIAFGIGYAIYRWIKNHLDGMDAAMDDEVLDDQYFRKDHFR